MKTSSDILELGFPAAEWRDAWPTGDGRVGALVLGGIEEETIILNHEGLWLYGQTGVLPDTADALQVVRSLMSEKRYQEAHNYYRDHLNSIGYSPEMSSFSPAATLKVLRNVTAGISAYRRILDMSSGEVTVSWCDGDSTYRQHVFSSRTSGRIHYPMEADGLGLLNQDFQLQPLNGEADKDWLQSYKLDFKRETTIDGLVLRGRDGSGRLFGAVAGLTAQGGTCSVQGDSLCVSGASTIDLELTILADAEAGDFVHGSAGTAYEDALSCHREQHESLYNRIRLELSGPKTADILRMFDYGRYLMIASGGGSLPPNLQGLWNGDLLPIWNCFYMINENIQMMHWLALPGGMPEFLFSMFEFYESRMDDFRENARKLFGCRGIFIPANITPDSGLLTDLQGHLIHWVSGAAWLARFYFDYYLYTGDEAFLKERALPFMRETALFLEDYLYEGENGELEFCPSVSPENAPEEFNREFRMDALCNVTINATMDVALCRELLSNLLRVVGICGEDAAETRRWEDMLSRLPAYLSE